MDNDIRKKLFDYSETPPPGAWQRIDEALEGKPGFAQKLFAYEEAPRAAIWNKIDQQLQTPVKVVPLRTQLFKYAIAAAVLLAVAAGIFYYTKPGNAGGIAPTANQQQPSPSATTPDTQATQHRETFSSANTANVSGDSKDPNTGTTIVHYTPQAEFSKNIPGQLAVQPEPKNIIDTKLPDRYMIATTPTGKVVRLPKKAYSDYACAVSYPNYPCKEKMAALQSKMAASVATDFTDFMDLLKKLQDTP